MYSPPSSPLLSPGANQWLEQCINEDSQLGEIEDFLDETCQPSLLVDSDTTPSPSQRDPTFGDTSSKHFACTQCTKKFSYKRNLNRHIKTHTQMKNFICEVCGNRFMRSDHLSLHLQTHTQDKKSFACSLCSKHFTQKSSLTRHTNKQHAPPATP